MRCIAAFAFCLALTGCAGTNFDFDQARQVQVGMTAAQVTKIMGSPYSVTTRAGAEIWIWSRANGLTGSSRAVSFTLRNGVVETVPVIPESFGGSDTQIANGVARAPVPAPPVQASRPAAPAQLLSEQAYKDAQVQQLMQQNLSYEEYQARYKKIMGE